MNYNYLSDFVIREVHKNGIDPTVPFKFTYSTWPDKQYVASYDGKGAYTNCKLNPDGSLLVIFNNHGLAQGHLSVIREYMIPDSDFPDGIRNEVSKEYTGIVLVSGKTDTSIVTIDVMPGYKKGDKGDTGSWADMTPQQRQELQGSIESSFIVEDPALASKNIKKLAKEGKEFNPLTTTDAVMHTSLNAPVSTLINEVNVSQLYPTGGIGGTNKYTLATAIAKIPADLRNVGIKCSFVSEYNEVEMYVYQGGSFTDADMWKPVGTGGKNAKASGEVCNSKAYKYVQCGNVSNIMVYSDKQFGNLGSCMSILIKFKTVMNMYQDGMPNTIITKGDYLTNGWAIMYKNVKGDNNLYFCVNGTYYPIIEGMLNLFSQLVEISIVSCADSTVLRLYGQKVVEITDTTTSVEALKVGGYSDRYTFNYLYYLSMSSRCKSDQKISQEFDLITRNFYRHQIDADFVASPLSLDVKGYTKEEQEKLQSSANCAIAVDDVSVPKGVERAISNFEKFEVMKFHNDGVRFAAKNAKENMYHFCTKPINVEGCESIIIYKAAACVGLSTIVCLGDNGDIISNICSQAINPTKADIYEGYRDIYEYQLPPGAKRVIMTMRYDSFYQLVKQNEIYTQCKELTNKNVRLYDRTPLILFDSSKLINALGLKEYNEAEKWVPVTQVGDKLTIATTHLTTGLKDTYCVYNAVAKIGEELGFIHVYRTDGSGTLHILDKPTPQGITAITTHEWNAGGEMHLSSNASKAVGAALVDATKDTSNYLVGSCTGWLQLRHDYPTPYNVLRKLDDKSTLIDPKGNYVFNAQGFIGNGLNEMVNEWGIYAVASTYQIKSDKPGVILSLRQKAKFKRGHYEINAVSPRYNYKTKEHLTTAPVVCVVKNNGRVVDQFTICDWMMETHHVYLDWRNTSDCLYNVNTKIENKSYNLLQAVNAASAAGALNVDTILCYRHGKNWLCCVYSGDNPAYINNYSYWEPFEWGNVEISFEQQGEGKSLLYPNRIMQYEEIRELVAYPINKDSYVGWLGDSWTYCADNDEMNIGYAPLDRYDFEVNETKGTVMPTKETTQCPLPRTLADKTGCKIDLWGRGTKTASWAWQYQVWRMINTRKYTHIVIEYFSNDQGSTNDVVAEVIAIARVCQENGIIPIIFGPTTAAKSTWFNEYKYLY